MPDSVGLSVSCVEELVARLSPHSGQIRSALEYLANPNTSAERPRRSRVSTEEEREDDLLPQLIPVPGTELRLTPYPERSFPPGATPQEITQHSLDSTYTLNSMISQYSRSVPMLNPFKIKVTFQPQLLLIWISLLLSGSEKWQLLSQYSLLITPINSKSLYLYFTTSCTSNSVCHII